MTDDRSKRPVIDPWDEPKLSADGAGGLEPPPITQLHRSWIIGLLVLLLVGCLGSVVYAMANRQPRKNERGEVLAKPRPYGDATARVPESIRQLELATTPATTEDKPARHPDDVDLPDSTIDALPMTRAEPEDELPADPAAYEPAPARYAASTSRQPHWRSYGDSDDSTGSKDDDDELPPIEMPSPRGESRGGAAQVDDSPSQPLGGASTTAGLAQSVGQLGQLAAALKAAQGQDADDDDDGRKEKFMGRDGLGSDLGGEVDIGECEIAAGTPVHASGMQAINTDLPAHGIITARVVQAVYCGADHQHIAIPPGATFSGSADARVAYGQDKILLCIQRLRRPPSRGHPNGTKMDTGCLAVADITGQVGMPAEVDNHWGQLISGALLSTLLSMGTTASAGNQDGFAPTFAQGVARQAGANISQVGQRIVQRDLQRKPTLRTEQLEFAVVFWNRDAQLEPWVERPRR